MVALVVAAVLWQAPATLRVPNGDTRTLDVPVVAGPARLVFRVRADYWRPAGSNHLLRIVLNGRDVGLMRDRRTARTRTDGGRTDPGLRRYDFRRWRVSQGPVANAADEIALDVSDLLRPGAANVLTFECAPPGSLGPTPLVIDDVRFEAAEPVAVPPPPDERTPRLAGVRAPRFAVDGDEHALRVSWNGATAEVRTAVVGGLDRWTRAIERLPTHVVVRDTFANGTSAVVGLHVRHAVASDARWVWLGGRADPDVADAYSPWNPTVFLPVAGGGVGLVAEDDVLRQQLHVDVAADGSAGMRTDMLCVGPGETVTLAWSVYPIARPDYWDFVATVRADWRLDRTVPGSYVWFSPDDVLAASPERLAAALAEQGTAYAAMLGGWVDPRRPERPALIGFGTFVLAPEFADYRRRIRDAIDVLRRARPGIRVLLYFDAQRESAPDAPSRFPDSLLRDPTGAPERVDWAGRYAPSWGMVPTADDAYGRALPDVVAALRALGADGLYWDEMDGVDFRGPRLTSTRWDGHSCMLDDAGNVRARVGLVNLLSDEVKVAYADAAGLVLGNVPPTTRRFVDRDDLRMVEAFHAEAWGPFAHLATPLGYVGDRTDWARIRARIDEGLLVAGGRLDGGQPILARMFPFTPERLQAGTLRGRERIVTTQAGVHGWTDCPGAVRAFRYDRDGHERSADWRVKRRRGGAFVRVGLGDGEAAVIECAR